MEAHASFMQHVACARSAWLCPVHYAWHAHRKFVPLHATMRTLACMVWRLSMNFHMWGCSSGCTLRCACSWQPLTNFVPNLQCAVKVVGFDGRAAVCNSLPYHEYQAALRLGVRSK
eukprot:scaffold127475_cov18-Tisochrysis_lutea.AAC.1